MTLTSPMCPYGPQLVAAANAALTTIPGVETRSESGLGAAMGSAGACQRGTRGRRWDSGRGRRSFDAQDGTCIVEQRQQCEISMGPTWATAARVTPESLSTVPVRETTWGRIKTASDSNPIERMRPSAGSQAVASRASAERKQHGTAPVIREAQSDSEPRHGQNRAGTAAAVQAATTLTRCADATGRSRAESGPARRRR